MNSMVVFHLSATVNNVVMYTVYRDLFECLLSVLWGIHLEVEFLGQVVMLSATF